MTVQKYFPSLSILSARLPSSCRHFYIDSDSTNITSIQIVQSNSAINVSSCYLHHSLSAADAAVFAHCFYRLGLYVLVEEQEYDELGEVLQFHLIEM
ncbi:hypothetical protein HJC23_013458 [Cyclotella cryptica]|uniref:Uncharacterized protein n=1 Tax=Cyclotella cryptica TaxID=29204 RepID=A0ABD3NEY2_9STRA